MEYDQRSAKISHPLSSRVASQAHLLKRSGPLYRFSPTVLHASPTMAMTAFVTELKAVGSDIISLSVGECPRIYGD